MKYEKNIIADKETLWGTAGGQLEFISMETFVKEVVAELHPGGKRWEVCIRLKFTDHDMQAVPDCDDPYYYLEFPVHV